MDDDFVTVGEAAAETGLSARSIANAIYNQKLDQGQCCLRGGRRWVARAYLAELKQVMQTDRRKLRYKKDK